MSKKVTWSFKRDDVTHNEEGTFRTTVDIPTSIETQTVANGTNDGNGKINQQEVDNGIGKTHHSERGVSDTKETPVEADKSAAGDTNATTVPQKVNEGSGKQHHSETGTSDTKKTSLAADKNVAEELRSSGERHANLTTEPQEFDNGNGKTQQSETGISSIKKTSGEANENASEGIVVMIPIGTQTGGMQAVTKEPETGNKAVTRVGIRDIILRELNAPLHAEDEKSFAWMEKQFRRVAGSDGTLDKEGLRKALQTKKSFFTDRLFKLFDDDNSGSIDVVELLHGINKLTRGTPTEKLQFLFSIYDADSSGTISREELYTVLLSCMEESSLNLSDENLDALTDALFEDADTDKSGEISFDELKEQLEKNPGVMSNLTISTAKWLLPKREKKQKSWVPRKLTLTYIRNNLVKVIFTVVYLLINVGLYVLNAWLYRDSNWYIIIARGAGMCLNFNCAVVLVLMLRKTLTLLRNTPLVKILPFDHSVMFHKLAGYAIVIFTLIHTGAHLGNAAVYLTEDMDLKMWEILFTLKTGIGWIHGFAPLSGVILDVILAVMFICSMDFVRRSGFFEVFYWTHKLYIPFFILNILHGANFWKWIVGPGVIFIVEMILKLKWIRRGGSIYISSVRLLPSGVTELIITRPSGFDYKPGDYIFLNIPSLAKYEWHPFTISSAPETLETFSLHIRSAGHWTRMVYQYFEKLLEADSSPSDAENGRANGKASTRSKDSWKSHSTKSAFAFRRRNTKAKKIASSYRKRVKMLKVNVPVNVDGPYGTPSRHIFEAEHAVLIGSGIGVTPFASILQSIMYRLKAAEVECPQCLHRFGVDVPKSVMNLKKVDFVWINRDQRHFEWFLSLLTRLESEQARDSILQHRLDMHMYMTSAVSKSDMKGIGLQMALDLIHESEQTDLITGLQTRTQPGRPDFDKLFSQISKKAKGKVKVFFCGAPVLGRTVKHYSHKYKFGFSQETF